MHLVCHYRIERLAFFWFKEDTEKVSGDTSWEVHSIAPHIFKG